MMEDARVTGRELHWMVADLSKAFATMEYWSQALSWKCLGLPEDIIELLVNMDAGKKAEAGATTQVALSQGRVSQPFKHERGVRQGSVGGPLKWCVFVHFWIKWVKREMKGKGYTMSEAASKTPGVKEWAKTEETEEEERAGSVKRSKRQGGEETSEQGMGKRTKREEDDKAEIIGQCFIDDSIWATESGSDMQHMLRMHELFCDFHQVDLHKKKSEYFSINGKGAQVRWTPREQPETQNESSDGPDSKHGLHKFWQTVPNPSQAGHTTKNNIGSELRDKAKGEKGASFKYLGVWFDVAGGWKTQIAETTKKIKELVGKLKRAKVTLPQAVVAINTTIIPTALYPMQVAIASKSVVEGWDRLIRAAVRAAGAIHSGLAEEFFYLPIEDGGLGVRALQDAIDEQRIKLDLQSLNDENYTKREGRGKSTLARVVAAAKKRGKENPKEKGTQNQAVRNAQSRMGIEVTETPYEKTARAMAMRDCSKAEAVGVKSSTMMTAYTDGSTVPLPVQDSGWGWVAQIPKARQGLFRRGHGKLKGLQDNYTAESMALLQVLIETHTTTSIHICIDNQGVVNRWERDLKADPRARSKTSARAIWNRIEHMKQIRNNTGSDTKISWVHSHVERDGNKKKDNIEAEENEEEEKKETVGKKRKVRGAPSLFPYTRDAGEKGETGEKEGRKEIKQKEKTVVAPKHRHRCVCGEERCNKEHVHHRGNDEADKEADKGREDKATDKDCPIQGEERYYMTYRGSVCQGDITVTLKQASQANRLNRMENSAKRTEREARAALKHSNDSMRKGTWKGSDVATRFTTRALADRLPTYENEDKLIQSGNAYEYMYGQQLEGGKCMLCGLGCKETLSHVLCECEEGKDIREKAVREVGNLWDNTEKEGGWPMYDYIGTRIGEWRQEWGWLGLTPDRIANAGTPVKDIAILKKASKILARAGHDIWVNRVKKVREWESETGIAPRKTEVTGHKWAKPEGPKKKRDRPRKPEEELGPEYLKLRNRADRIRELISEGMTPPRAKVRAVREGKEETKQKANELAAKGMDPIQTARVSKQEAARQFKQQVTYRAKTTKVKKVKSKARATDKKRWGERELNADDLEAYRVVQGGCDHRGCDNQGTILPSFCNAHSMRCKEHESIFCLGFRTLCACRREDTGKKPDPVKITNERWEKLKQVEEGDKIRIRKVKGRQSVITGEVIGFEWESVGGFRVPDHILIEWKNRDGEVEEGAVRVDEDWENVSAWGQVEGGAESSSTHRQKPTEPGAAAGVGTRTRRAQTSVCEHDAPEINTAPLDIHAGGEMYPGKRDNLKSNKKYSSAGGRKKCQKNVSGGKKIVTVDAAANLRSNFTFDKLSVRQELQTTTGQRDGEGKEDDGGADARQGGKGGDKQQGQGDEDRHGGLGESEEQRLKQDGMDAKGGGCVGLKGDRGGAHGHKQDIGREGAQANVEDEQGGESQERGQRSEGGEGEGADAGEEMGGEACKGQASDCGSIQNPERQPKGKGKGQGGGQRPCSGSGGGPAAASCGGGPADRVQGCTQSGVGAAGDEVGWTEGVDRQEQGGQDGRTSLSKGDGEATGGASVPGTGLRLGGDHTGAEGQQAVEQGPGNRWGSTKPRVGKGDCEARHIGEVCDERAGETGRTIQILQEERGGKKGRIGSCMDILELQVGIHSEWPEQTEGGDEGRQEGILRGERKDPKGGEGDNRRATPGDKSGSQAGPKVPVCMGERGTRGSEGLQKDAGPARRGHADVWMRLWKQTHEALQGVALPRGEEDLQADTPYGQGVAVRQVQEGATTRTGDVPQKGVEAEKGQREGTDGAGGEEQGHLEDGGTHLDGAETSMGTSQRAAGEPEWMGNMRRRYNVLYEPPDGITQEAEPAEDEAGREAEVSMPAVAVAIETLPDDKINYLHDDWVHPTVHRDSTTASKNNGTHGQGDSGAPYYGAPGGVVELANPVFEGGLRPPRGKRKAAHGQKQQGQGEKLGESNCTERTAKKQARSKGPERRHGHTAVGPGAQLGARVPQGGRQRRQKTPRQEAAVTAEPEAKRRRKERNQPKGYG